MTIFHITSEEEAALAMATGQYVPKAFAREGFIHCSYRSQLLPVANRIFRGRSGLVILEIETAALTSTLVDENLEGGTELFPHLYGELPMRAVVQIHAFPCSREGAFVSPASLSATS